MQIIRFTINYQVEQKQKFERFLKQFEREIGYNLINLNIEKYWKKENQFQAIFYVETVNQSVEKMICKVLRLANKLWSSANLNWRFNGPHENNGFIYFECILNNENDDKPLRWAHIELDHSK